MDEKCFVNIFIYVPEMHYYQIDVATLLVLERSSSTKFAANYR